MSDEEESQVFEDSPPNGPKLPIVEVEVKTSCTSQIKDAINQVIIVDQLETSATVNELRLEVLNQLKCYNENTDRNLQIIFNDQELQDNENLFTLFADLSEVPRLNAIIRQEEVIDREKSELIIKLVEKMRRKRLATPPNFINYQIPIAQSFIKAALKHVQRDYYSGNLRMRELDAVNRTIVSATVGFDMSMTGREILTQVMAGIVESSDAGAIFQRPEPRQTPAPPRNRRILGALFSNRFMLSLITLIVRSPIFRHPNTFLLTFDLICQFFIYWMIGILAGFSNANRFLLVEIFHLLVSLLVFHLKIRRENSSGQQSNNIENQVQLENFNLAPPNPYFIKFLVFVKTFFIVIFELFASVFPNYQTIFIE